MYYREEPKVSEDNLGNGLKSEYQDEFFLSMNEEHRDFPEEIASNIPKEV